MPYFTYRVTASASTELTVHGDNEDDAYDRLLDKIANADLDDFAVSEADLRNNRFDVELIDEE